MPSDADTLPDVVCPESDIKEQFEKENTVVCNGFKVESLQSAPSIEYHSTQNNIFYALEDKPREVRVNSKGESLTSSSIGFSIGRSTYIQVYPPLTPTEHFLPEPSTNENSEIQMPSVAEVLSDVSSTQSDIDEVSDCSEAPRLLCGLPAECSSNPVSLLYASDDEPGEVMVNSEDDSFSSSSIGFTIGKSTYIQIYPPLVPTEHFLHESSSSNGEFRIDKLDSASDGSQTDEELSRTERDFLTSYCDDLSEDEFQLSPVTYPVEHFPSTSRSSSIIPPSFADLNNAAANDGGENMFADYLNTRVDKLTARKMIKSLRTIVVSKSHIRKGIQCTVCLEDFHLRQKVKSLPCKHFYHKRCITPWLQTNNTCPSCRKFVEILPNRQPMRSF